MVFFVIVASYMDILASIVFNSLSSSFNSISNGRKSLKASCSEGVYSRIWGVRWNIGCLFGGRDVNQIELAGVAAGVRGWAGPGAWIACTSGIASPAPPHNQRAKVMLSTALRLFSLQLHVLIILIRANGTAFGIICPGNHGVSTMLTCSAATILTCQDAPFPHVRDNVRNPVPFDAQAPFLLTFRIHPQTTDSSLRK